MHVTQASDHRESTASHALLYKQGVVQAQAVGELTGNHRIPVEVDAGESRVEKAILIFELITQGGLRPRAGNVIALIVEAGTVNVRQVAEKAVGEVKNSDVAAAIRPRVLVQRAVVIFEPSHTVLPMR